MRPLAALGRVLMPMAALFAGAAGAASTAPQIETELARIYAEITRGRLDEALRLDDALIAAYPNFRLAHLIRGDLLLARTRPLKRMGDAPGAPEDKLRDLREEAMVRLHGYRERPPANAVPRYLLQLRPEQKTAVVVDTKKSRLYLYENANGQPRFVADYYITQGKLGTGKQREGDQKTPIGIYHITGRLPGRKLPDFYGKGALPLDYPNDWDKHLGKTGSKIWLHGVPSDTYSRPPRASDGCVVLANADLRGLLQQVQVGLTPVIISDKVEWLSLDDWNAERQSLLTTIEAWRRDWEQLNTGKYLSHYSRRFESDNLNLAQWAEQKRQVQASTTWAKVTIRNLSMFRYPGKDDMVLVTFEQSYLSSSQRFYAKKRQYWVREGGAWHILFEATA